MAIKTHKIFLTTFCFLLSGFGYAQIRPKEESKEKKIVVFVCEHGAGRSVIASAYFNKLAQEQNLNYQAVFRGLIPDSTLSTDTKKGLTKDGFVTIGWTTKAISNQDIEKAAQIIALDCNLERDVSLNKPMQKWSNIPTITGNYEAARDFIYAKVKEYVAELKNTQKRD
jgi:protein-tyrosine-phosphatase